MTVAATDGTTAIDAEAPRPVLVVFGGLPGVGKSTVARGMASATGAFYLRVDSIERAIRASGILSPEADMGPAGYAVICDVTVDNLRLGRSVIADSVNPIAVTRDAYRRVAATTGADLFEVEVLCSDEEEHRRRVEERLASAGGVGHPGWDQVKARAYEPWNRCDLRLDTARRSPEESVTMAINGLTGARTCP